MLCTRELARSEASLLVSPTTASLHASFGAHLPMTLWIMAKVSAYHTQICSQSQLWTCSSTHERSSDDHVLPHTQIGYIDNPKLQEKLKHHGIKVHVYTLLLLWLLIEPQFPRLRTAIYLDIKNESHPMRRMCFGQYQALSAALR